MSDDRRGPGADSVARWPEALAAARTAARRLIAFHTTGLIEEAAALYADMLAAGELRDVAASDWGSVTDLPSACLSVVGTVERRRWRRRDALDETGRWLGAVAACLTELGARPAVDSRPSSGAVTIAREPDTPRLGPGKPVRRVALILYADDGWTLGPSEFGGVIHFLEARHGDLAADPGLAAEVADVAWGVLTGRGELRPEMSW